MGNRKSWEHHHWRYKVHWQLHHNSVVHLLFILAPNQRCKSLVFHCHFIFNWKLVSYIYCIFSPAEEGTCSPKHCATGLSKSESWWKPFPQAQVYILPTNHWCWKTFIFLVCYSFDTELIFRLHWKEVILCLPVTWRHFLSLQQKALFISFCSNARQVRQFLQVCGIGFKPSEMVNTLSRKVEMY